MSLFFILSSDISSVLNDFIFHVYQLDDEEEDEVPDLKQRLAKLNEQLASTKLEPSPDQSGGEHFLNI